MFLKAKRRKRQIKKLAQIVQTGVAVYTNMDALEMHLKPTFEDPGLYFQRNAQVFIDAYVKSGPIRDVATSNDAWKKDYTIKDELERKRFVAIMMIKRHPIIKNLDPFIRDLYRRSKKHKLTEAECDAIINKMNKIEQTQKKKREE